MRCTTGTKGGDFRLSTAKELRTLTAKKLSEMAKKEGISGISGMKKEDLVQALVKVSRSKSRQTGKKATAAKSGKKSTRAKTVKAKTPAKKKTTPSRSKRTPAKKTDRSTATAKSKAPRSRAVSSSTKPAAKSSTKKSGGAKTTVAAKSKTAPVKKAEAKPKPKAKPKPERKQNPKILKKLREDNVRKEQIRDLARSTRNGKAKNGEPAKDRIILIVRDSYWVQAYWEITRSTVERVKVALAENWHNASPTLRVFEIVEEGPTGASESVVQDIPVHGGVNNWYVPLDDPQKIYRVALGYKTSNDRFHMLVRSNKVEMPEPGGSDAVDEHWTDIAEDYQRFFAMSGGYSDDHNNGELQEVFETQLRRPMTAPKFTKFGVTPNHNGEGLHFQVEAEMIVFGTTDPNATVFLADEPVDVQSDGAFAARVPMPDRRQVLPVVASSRDGSLQRTIVLAIERNTKVMEQITKEIDD